MKLIMTLLVRDEEDIIKHNIEYHLSQGVDYFIVTDNKSVDSTKKILLEYERKGKLHYIFESEDNYDQGKWVTRMARLAYTGYNADWVINNDADEFWWPKKGHLKTTLESIDPRNNIVSAQRNNFWPHPLHEGPFYSTMVYRDTYSINFLGGPLEEKVAHRGQPYIIVAQGNHRVDGLNELNIVKNKIEILHYPMRSYSQFLNKILKGGAAYERNTVLDKNLGGAWRRLYKEYCKTGTLQPYYQSCCHDKKSVSEGLSSGRIIKDLRLSDYFEDLLK